MASLSHALQHTVVVPGGQVASCSQEPAALAELNNLLARVPSWGARQACTGCSTICCSSAAEGGSHEPLQHLEALRARLARTGRTVPGGSSLAAKNPALAAMHC
ncbi:hypothetical protein WJX72_006746 [[Myrmecia] bisecta]|uniref:Uncharacterized protein n=1 Tax=[Myrmecia] bisecta TaxID=41462 RepID=A0AAW1P3U5_9CHLO